MCMLYVGELLCGEVVGKVGVQVCGVFFHYTGPDFLFDLLPLKVLLVGLVLA